MRDGGLLAGLQHSSAAAELDGDHTEGWMTGAGGEAVLMVKLADECKHPETKWKSAACGHPRCELCGDTPIP